MTICSYLVATMPSDLYLRACSLSLRHKGYGRIHLRAARRDRHVKTRIILATSGKNLLGWSLLVQCLDPEGYLIEYSINMFVRVSKRLQGIGGRLFRETSAYLGRARSHGHVCIWSPASEMFYTTHSSPFIQVRISPRYRSLLIGT